MRYHDITTDDMRNGDGLRVVLWTAGCAHHCEGCQNPITWDPEGGLLFDRAAEEELFAKLNRDHISGLTFSGGDPLHPGNLEEVTLLAGKAKKLFPGKTVWLYTGADWEDIYGLPVMQHVDVCVDGEFQKDLLDATLMWKGSSNQRVIDVAGTLSGPDPKTPVLYCKDHYQGKEY